jgi:hypothetical protein
MNEQIPPDESKAAVGQSALNVELGGKFTPDWANYREGYMDGVVEANQQYANLRAALVSIASRTVICGSTGDFRDGQLIALEECRKIANDALALAP